MPVDPISAAIRNADIDRRPEERTPSRRPADLGRDGAELDGVLLQALIDEGLFDPDWYRRHYRDLPAGTDPVRHFLEAGAGESRWPNAHFDPGWYRQKQLSGPWPSHPIVHYFQVGEAKGLKPVPYFDPAWYAKRYLGPFHDISPLGHYIRGRSTGRLDPCPAFDTQYYVQENPDVVAAGLDPFEHFLAIGHREGRNPSAAFDLKYYRRRHMSDADGNPLLHYLDTGMRRGFDPDPASEVSVGSEVRRFARRAPEFEDFEPGIVGDREKLARLIAFYLPQFHAFPENDAWWGKGFTEWTNLSRGNPRFVGHYQPRVPRDLGFYDLGDPSVMRRQIDMARAAGVEGFCFYYYNFNGKRLLHAPVERFLASDTDWPFCIMWANENWSRRWDGSESQILIRQDYRADDEAALIDDLARHFNDPRYIRLGGRPLFFVYRPGIIPNARETIASWRATFRERHGIEPLMFLTQTFEDHDPAVFGLDGALEFPPHKILARTHQINPKLNFLDHGFSGHVYQYEDVIKASEAVPVPDFPLIKTVFPSWDNDARRQGSGVIATGSTPTKYREWLETTIRYARDHRIAGEALVFINAWNEWAEGAYLEPDIHFGSAYLNATARSVVGERTGRNAYPVLVVIGSNAPEPTLIAAEEFVTAISRDFGCDPHVVVLDRGGRASIPFAGAVTARFDALPGVIAQLRRKGVAGAFVFGVSAGDAVIPLHAAGLKTVSFLTELPLAVVARTEGDLATTLVRLSDVLVASSAAVLSTMTARFGPATGQLLVQPPAGRRVAVAGRAARAQAAASLGLPVGTRLVVNVGPANLQTGADLFASVAAVVTAGRDDVAFVWLGDLDPSLGAWLDRGGPGRALQFRPASDLAADPIAIAEVLAFTAREDANASVVSTAVTSGVPVVAFEGSGAAEDHLAAHPEGSVVAPGDVAAFAAAIIERLESGRGLLRDVSATLAAPARSGASRFDLLRETDPTVLPVSVVMLHRRGERDGDIRLASLLAQSRPVAEIVVLADDLSAAERETLNAAAAEAGRSVRIVDETLLRLSLAQQLARAAGSATAEFVWIATEGDYPAHFLGELTSPLAVSDAVASVFLPPRRGELPLAMRGMRSAAELAKDGELDEAVASVGAVLWRRRALLDALQSLPPAAADAASAILRHVATRSGLPVFIGPAADPSPAAEAEPAPAAPPAVSPRADIKPPSRKAQRPRPASGRRPR